MNTSSQPTALVTGASSGLGLEFSKLLAADGYQLVLTARDAQQLEAAAELLHQHYQVKPKLIVADLADPAAPQQIAKAAGPVDVLINNAGFGGMGQFAERDTAKDLAMIQVNVTALTHLAKLVLPAMLAAGSGRILNVASTAAFVPGPLQAVYYASKAYVLSLSEALANETNGTGVSVTALCPGPTKTNFAKAADVQGSALFTGRGVMDAPTVARIGYRAMLAGKPVVVAGFRNKLVALAGRLLPSKITAAAARRSHQ